MIIYSKITFFNKILIDSINNLLNDLDKNHSSMLATSLIIFNRLIASRGALRRLRYQRRWSFTSQVIYIRSHERRSRQYDLKRLRILRVTNLTTLQIL